MENGPTGLLRGLFQVLPYTQCNLGVEEREVKKNYSIVFLSDYVKCKTTQYFVINCVSVRQCKMHTAIINSFTILHFR